MKLAEYTQIDGKNYFKGIIDAPFFDDKYHIIFQSTALLPKVEPKSSQNLILENKGTENEAWVIEEIILAGNFYEKKGGKMETEIFQRDIEKYTQIKPFEDFDDGSIQNFNETLQNWEYLKKGEKVLELELKEKFDKIKEVQLAKIQQDYQLAQQVLIKNCKTVVIKIMGQEYTDLQREFNKSGWRMDKLAILVLIDLNDKKRYKLTISRSFGKFLLTKIQNISQNNFFKKEIALQKIERNELTFEELSVLKLDFIFNSEININDEAEKYINDDYYKSKYPEDVEFIINSKNKFFTELNAE